MASDGRATQDDRASAIAKRFVAARKGAAALPDYPGDAPTDLDAAYAIQAQAVAAWHEPVVGWKVGRIPAPQDASFGVDRLAGPIFASQVHHSGADDIAMPVFDGGFAAIEAEFVAVLAAAPPVGQMRFTLEEAAALIDRMHCGIEIASSPLATINALGSAVTISDFGNNAGLIVGPEIVDWRNGDFARWPVSVEIDGAQVGVGRAEAMPDGPIGAVRFLLETAAMRGLCVGAGTFVSTGAVSGVHETRSGVRSIARFDERVAIACRLTTATPLGV